MENMMTRKKWNNLAYRVSQEIKGKTLAHSFIVVKRDNLRLNVHTLNGEKIQLHDQQSDFKKINVIVENGLIEKTWIG